MVSYSQPVPSRHPPALEPLLFPQGNYPAPPSLSTPANVQSLSQALAMDPPTPPTWQPLGNPTLDPSWTTADNTHVEVTPHEPNPPHTLRRRYKVQKECNVVFLCGGRLVTGNRPAPFLFAVVLIVIPVVLFCVFECSFIWYEVDPVWVILFGYITLLVFNNMFRTSWTDPGILPQDLHIDPLAYVTAGEPALVGAHTSYPNASMYAGTDPTLAYPLSTKEVLVHGMAVRIKYCDTCRIYRPPRASHCRLCNMCVENEDHHCAWLNNCVGRRNYRYFFLFVLSTTALSVYVFSFSLWHLLKPIVQELPNEYGQPTTFGDSLGQTPISLALMIYTFVFFWSVGGLTVYHGYLMARNLTTHEQIKSSYSRSRRPRGSPFGRNRSWLGNFVYVLCRARTEPPVPWRELVDPDPEPHRPTTARSVTTNPPAPQSDVYFDTRDQQPPRSDHRSSQVSSTMTPLTTYVPAKPTSLTTGPNVPPMEDSTTDYRPPLFLPEPLDSGHDTISTDWSDSLFSTVNATRSLYPDTLPSGSAVTTTTPLGNTPLIHQASFHTTASSVSTTTPALANPSTATILPHSNHSSHTPIDYELSALGKTSSLIRPSLKPTSAAQSAHQRYL